MSEVIMKSDLDPNWKIPKHTPIDPAEPATVTISKDLYEELLSDSKLLQALEAAGVDNWDGYDIAREDMD